MGSLNPRPTTALRTFHGVTDLVEDLLKAPLFNLLSVNKFRVDHICNFFALAAIPQFSATLDWVQEHVVLLPFDRAIA
jgi:hypothetical protein